MSDTRTKPLTIKAVLELQTEQERFLSLVALSGLTKAEYIRRCCLEPRLIVIPDHNIRLYGALGTLHVTLKRAVKQTPTPELEMALAEVQTLRLSLVGMLEADEDATAGDGPTP